MVKQIERIYNDFIYTDDEKTTKLTRDDFIKQNFITTNDKNDRLYTEDICNILLEKGFKLNTIHIGKIFNQLEIGKHNNKCYINKIRKAGFEYIKYIGGGL